ncbi:polyprenyl synthetase family protein [Halomonas sp. M20]|uniref:polyprenyl synthetase family protein n=1 Tax=Halomonas sp. M20 TaxID=2763264 RepID=UPI001D0A6C61|nr:polyprenyl synthetase family protein [Halomonas sp. M20]
MSLTFPNVAFDSDDFASLDGIRQAVERRLDGLLTDTQASDDPVSQAMRSSVLAPGKRIRPLLLVLAARELDCREPALFDLGASIEMIHTASLILDDLPCMDNASMRRGRPTVHRQYGEDVAMLAVVALLSRALGVVSDASTLPAEQRTRMIGQLSRAADVQGLVKGQYEDLHEAQKPRSVADVMATNRHKTGVLFQASMQLVAVITGIDKAAADSLERFALALGQAYQLSDDLGDCSAAHGKDADQDRDKATLVNLLGAEEVCRLLSEQLEEADRQLTFVYGPCSALGNFTRSLFPCSW